MIDLTDPDTWPARVTRYDARDALRRKTVRTIDRYCDDGKLKRIHVGTSVLIDTDSLKALMGIAKPKRRRAA